MLNTRGVTGVATGLKRAAQSVVRETSRWPASSPLPTTGWSAVGRRDAAVRRSMGRRHACHHLPAYGQARREEDKQGR
jgi:hypothetical protein